MPGQLATDELRYWVQQTCFIEPGSGKNHNFITPDFKYSFGLKRRGGHGRGNTQREFVCLGHDGECPGTLEGEGHVCVPVTTEYLVDQTLNMKLRLVTAAESDAVPAQISLGDWCLV